MPLSMESKIVLGAERDKLQRNKKAKDRELQMLKKKVAQLQRQMNSIDGDIAKFERDMKL